MLDIDTGVAEARTLHPSPEGWFAIFRKNVDGLKTSDRPYSLRSLDAVVHALDKAPDAYVSQASFVRASRKVANFKSINCAFVDIGCYSGAHNSPVVVPDEAFIARLHEHARAASIPTPSYTTLSGRGVYCKWIFDKPLAAHQLIRWKALQAVLVPLFAAFGVDSKAKDAARVLRVMGSAHADTGSIVRVGSNTHQVHNFDALCNAAASIDISKLVMPATHRGDARTAKTQVRKIKAGGEQLIELNQDTSGDLAILRTYEAMREPVMLRAGARDAMSLHWSRFVDLRTLAESRGGIHVGSRDVMMFWMATSLAHAGVVTSENLDSEISEMIGAFSGPGFDPIGERSMMSVFDRLKEREAGRVVQFKGGSYDPLYTATNDHLIDVLSITAEEQLGLTTIIGGEEKLRRADAKVEGRADRRQHRIEWRGQARQMEADALAAGETRYVAKIARALKVQRSEVSRLLAGKLDRDPNQVETRGRKKVTRTGSKAQVKIIVARYGSLTRSIWVDAEHATNKLLHKSMDLAAQRAEPPPAFESAVEFVSNHLFSFERQKCGFFTLTRKREEEKVALARETKSKAFQAGGPRVAPKVDAQTPAAPLTSVAPASAPSANVVWAGWGSLAELSKARTGIVGKRQSNQKAIPSEGWVKITRPDGRTKSIPLIPIATIMKAAKAQAPKTPKKPTPIYVDAKTGEINFEVLRAEVLRIQTERAKATEAARIRDINLDEADRAQKALAASNRLKEILDRSKSANLVMPAAVVEDKMDFTAMGVEAARLRAAQKSVDPN